MEDTCDRTAPPRKGQPRRSINRPAVDRLGALRHGAPPFLVSAWTAIKSLFARSAVKRVFLVTFAAFAAGQVSAQAEGQVTPQVHDPENCGAGDKTCFKEWYNEYKVGLLGEFNHYRSIENDVARSIQNSDDMLAARLVEELVAGNYYKHNHWKFAKSFTDGAGPTLKQYETIIWDCRVAISTMKFLLIDIQDYHDEISGDRKSYVELARTCERVFKLGLRDSMLRHMK